MATFTRQPFAPLDGARLQSLTSLKNRQNALPVASIKRKASEVDTDDFENVDPTLFSKRPKGADDKSDFTKDFFKPSGGFILTKAATPITKDATPKFSSLPSTTAARPRTILKPKSARLSSLNTRISQQPTSSPLTAPAGRSPTRGSKRIGILGKRRTQRVDPPAFKLGGIGGAPFSLDAALRGTIPSYSGSSSLDSKPTSSFGQDDGLKSSWFFEIHEDTPEQEMTNLLQHSTCTLDISSDEESERRASRDRAEGRDKENIPPPDDVSQTSARARNAAAAALEDDDKMALDKARGPLVEMNVADYYAEGCDESTVFLVPDDEDYEDAETVVGGDEEVPHLLTEDENPEPEQPALRVALAEESFEFAPKVDVPEVSIDALMGRDDPAAKAAVLEPIEGTGESFVLWESQSANDPASPRDVPEMEDPQAVGLENEPPIITVDGKSESDVAQA
ncbi:hypothetical protein V8F20_011888 [Naviculisporaceae sp. PSN 640]